MGGEFKSGGEHAEDTMWFPDNWLYMPLSYHCNWNKLIAVGMVMSDMVLEGKWGEQAHMFSDEMKAMDEFRQGCYDLDISAAHAAVLDFISAINNRDKDGN